MNPKKSIPRSMIIKLKTKDKKKNTESNQRKMTHYLLPEEQLDDCEELQLWLSKLQTSVVSMRMRVRSLASLSGLRVWRCHELCCRLQMWLGSGFAVAVVSSICCRCGPKKEKQTNQPRKHEASCAAPVSGQAVPASPG